MTKLFTLLLLLLCLGKVSDAQNQGKTEFGIGVGYNAANVTADDATNQHYRSGFNAGVYADHYFSDSWSLKVKLIYDQKGWNNGFIYSNAGSYTTNFKLNYLTIPVLANWHFGRTKNWYLNFGPYAGVLLSASETGRGMDIKSILNKVDGGLDVGIGIKLPISENTKFFIEFNGQGGVSDVIKNNTGTTIRNTVSAFNVGLNF